MSRKGKRPSRRPGSPTKVAPYTGPILHTGEFIHMDDGTVYEFTIPKSALTDGEWNEYIAMGMVPSERR